MVQNRFASAALMLLMAGCAQLDQSDNLPSSAAFRFAAALEGADQAVEAAIERMDGFERLALREDAAIAYAASRGRVATGFNPPGAGAAEAAGDAIDPAFTALSDYAHILGRLAAGQPIDAKPGPSGEMLAGMVGTALDRLAALGTVVVPLTTRSASLDAISVLTDMPEFLARHGTTPTLAGVVREAAPQVTALVAMLRLVVGPEASTGTRGAIRQRRLALDAQHRRFLETVRQDSRIGAGERYAIFRGVADLRDSDPAPGTLAALIGLLDALEQAHAAIALDAEDAGAKVAGFEAAIARVAELAADSRRG